jgi:ribosomal protein S12 methylthiotransferase accessory factor
MEKVVQVGFPGGMKVEARFGERIVVTDQPVKEGGEDSAPTPFEIFLASIATCAGHYALGFCSKRGLSVEGLGLRVRFVFDERAKRYTRVVTEIVPPRDFPEKYREALARAVDLCYVKRHIVNPPEFAVLVV